MSCEYFKQGTCSHNKSDDTKGIRYNHFAVLALPMAGLSYIPNLTVKINPKNHLDQKKNQVNVGATWASPQFHRIAY